MSFDIHAFLISLVFLTLFSCLLHSSHFACLLSVHPYRATAPETVLPEYAALADLIGKYTQKAVPILSGQSVCLCLCLCKSACVSSSASCRLFASLVDDDDVDDDDDAAAAAVLVLVLWFAASAMLFSPHCPI
jgi:hypothetical protein